MPSTQSSPRFASFSELSAHLDALGLFRMTPGLERMRAVLDRLGLRRPPFTVAQVAGTNGKGSVSTMLAALGRAHGLKTGLHTSPHFCSVRERVRVNGAPLPEETWTALGSALMNGGGETLTYFEFVTCLAVLAFAEAGVELAVMETGLGGRYDATTALKAELLVFTPIDRDHELVLGPDIRDIASEKAGAMRPGGPAVSAAQRPEVMDVLKRAAAELGCVLHGPEALPPLPRSGRGAPALRLPGAHQLENARLALAAWRLLERKDAPEPPSGARPEGALLSERERLALESAWLPGRLQYLPPRFPGRGPFAGAPLGQPPLLLDGAHNPHGLDALGQALAGAGIAPSAVIFTCMADKDIEGMLPRLRALATGPILVPPVHGNPRAMPPEELAGKIGLNAESAPSLALALERAAGLMAERLPEAFAEKTPLHPLLVCGSLYLLGELYGLLPEALEEAQG